jgi:predicted RNA binding protein YcfA (HicA-like mRNA interferase family)
MTKLPVVSSDDAIRALKKAGFVYAPRRGKGSHVALYRLDHHGRQQATRVRDRCGGEPGNWQPAHKPDILNAIR